MYVYLTKLSKGIVGFRLEPFSFSLNGLWFLLSPQHVEYIPSVPDSSYSLLPP